MRFFHNASVGRVLALLYAVVIHALFGLGAYYMYLALASFMVGENAGAQVAAIAVAAAVFIGSMWAFMYGEYAREDVEAFQRARYGHPKGGKMHWWLNGLIAGVALSELASLGYRLSQMPPDVRRVWLGAAGIITLGLALAFGKIIHVMANCPLEMKLQRARTQAMHSIADNSLKLVPGMTIAQKQRFLAGDAGVIDEVRTVNYDEIEESERRRREKAHRDDEEQSGLAGFVDTLMHPFRPFQGTQATKEADRLSNHNGNNGR